MPLETTIKSGFITDLIVPPPGTCGMQTPQLEQTSYDTALGILHDFEAFIRSSPLVADVQQLHPGHPKYIDVPSYLNEFGIQPHPDYATSDWVQFEITDKLPVLYAFSTVLIYHTAMRKTKTGFEGVTSAGSGVRIHGKFDIQKPAEQAGVLNFIEHNETRCNVFLSAYIKATTGSSHKTMHENFKQKWNDEMKKRLKMS